MNCNITEELIYDYLDGELDELTTLIIGEHLAGCERCRAVAAQIKQLFYELNKVERETVDFPEDLDGICKRVHEIYNEDKKNFSVKDYFSVQKEVFRRQVSFISLIPGTQFGVTAVGVLGKRVVKASEFLLKNGYKIAFPRG